QATDAATIRVANLARRAGAVVRYVGAACGAAGVLRAGNVVAALAVRAANGAADRAAAGHAGAAFRAVAAAVVVTAAAVAAWVGLTGLRHTIRAGLANRRLDAARGGLRAAEIAGITTAVIGRVAA